MAPLCPEDDTGSDRITNQLVFVPHSPSTGESCGHRLKRYFLLRTRQLVPSKAGQGLVQKRLFSSRCLHHHVSPDVKSGRRRHYLAWHVLRTGSFSSTETGTSRETSVLTGMHWTSWSSGESWFAFLRSDIQIMFGSRVFLWFPTDSSGTCCDRTSKMRRNYSSIFLLISHSCNYT